MASRIIGCGFVGRKFMFEAANAEKVGYGSQAKPARTSG